MNSLFSLSVPQEGFEQPEGEDYPPPPPPPDVAYEYDEEEQEEY